ncbi:hypothetical protein KR222_009090, partial [Zaprionus bogoriensis]
WQVLSPLPVFLCALCQLFVPAAGEAVTIKPDNIKDIAHSNELLLLLFYSDGCRFSRTFMPIFDTAADQLRLEYGDRGIVTLGKVDCMSTDGLASRFNIHKYPTVRIARLGFLSKTEYRGRRSVEALVEFVHNELKEPTKEFDSLKNLQTEDNHKYLIIGYFQHRNQVEYQVFRQISISMKDLCQFHVNFAENSDPARITFSRDLETVNTLVPVEYSGNLTNFTQIHKWVENKCARLVRQLTFDNAEEIAEEGLQFVLLFHSKGDKKSVKEFESIVETQLIDKLQMVNFLTAYAEDFTNPISYLGKAEEDLPFIAIDSFDHMYVFPRYQDIHKPGELNRFVDRLLSGDLHREYHSKDIIYQDLFDELFDTSKEDTGHNNKDKVDFQAVTQDDNQENNQSDKQ